MTVCVQATENSESGFGSSTIHFRHVFEGRVLWPRTAATARDIAGVPSFLEKKSPSSLKCARAEKGGSPCDAQVLMTSSESRRSSNLERNDRRRERRGRERGTRHHHAFLAPPTLEPHALPRQRVIPPKRSRRGFTERETPPRSEMPSSTTNKSENVAERENGNGGGGVGSMRTI